MAEIVLRPYQRGFIDTLREAFKAKIDKRTKKTVQCRRVIGVAPCGAGKTIMTGWMIKESLKKGLRSVFIVHRKELVDQTAETFERLHLPFGVIASGYAPDYEQPIQIASVQTLINRLRDVPEPDFIICDECHHILANTYMQILIHWRKAFLLGVTATPVRLSQKEKLNKIFQAMVVGKSTPGLIKLGNLAKARTYTIEFELELDNISIDKGDYDKHALSKVMVKPDLCKKIVTEYLKRARDKKAIAYCVDVAHSKLLAETFCEYGVNAIQCDGATPKKKRQEIIEGFRGGTYQILCNAELFGEGFDVPDCQAVILARPTKSLGLYIQQAMRPMRPDPKDPNKEALVFDFVGNVDNFGDINEDRNSKWLEEFYGAKQAGKGGDAPTKKCKHCDKEVSLNTVLCVGSLEKHEVDEIFEEAKNELRAAPFETMEQAYNSMENLLNLHNDEVLREITKTFGEITLLYRKATTPETRAQWLKSAIDNYARYKIYMHKKGCGYCFHSCGVCGAIVPYKAVNCPVCGADVHTARLDAEDIEEIESATCETSEKIQKKVHYLTFPEILENIISVQKDNHYKPGWIYYRLKDFAKTFEDFLHAAKRLKIRKPEAWAGYQMTERAATLDELKEIEFKAGFKNGWAYVQAKKLGIAIP